MEPSTRAPFSEITQHLEQILEQLPEPTPLAKTPLAKAPLTYNQGEWHDLDPAQVLPLLRLSYLEEANWISELKRWEVRWDGEASHRGWLTARAQGSRGRKEKVGREVAGGWRWIRHLHKNPSSISRIYVMKQKTDS